MLSMFFFWGGIFGLIEPWQLVEGVKPHIDEVFSPAREKSTG